MTQEEKDLLMKDLCSRLPYGVIVQVDDGLRGTYDRRLVQVFCDRLSCSVNVCNPLKECICIDSVKLYLRPLSSMTDEEEKQFQDVNLYELPYTVDGIDWLNAHHFDYRGLIPKGLAIEAFEGMYNS